MVSILNGIDPSGIPYTVTKMRDHLIKGLENQNITVFPHRQLSVKLHYRLYLGSVFDRNDKWMS